MFDTSFMIIWPWADGLPWQQMIRLWLVLVGALIACHYILKAKAMRRGPIVVKYVLLPGSAGCAVGMIVCGAIGQTGAGAFFATLASGVLITSELAAFAYGARFGVVFERAAQAEEAGAPRSRKYDLVAVKDTAKNNAQRAAA